MTLIERLCRETVVLLDGGLSTMLEHQGHDLSDDLWSARLLADDPGSIEQAHLAFLDAGAEVVITASYQATVEGFLQAGWTKGQAERLLKSSTSLARSAVALHGGDALVASSVGPYGAYLADGSEYTGRYGLTHSQLAEFHARRLAVLLDTGPDLVACETVPCVLEAAVLADVLRGTGVEAWVSFTCTEGGRLRSGEELSAAVAAVVDVDEVVAVGVNCTPPPHVEQALRAITQVTDLPLVVYPNNGRRWDGPNRRWRGTGDDWIQEESIAPWLAHGLRIIGGCCGTDAADIDRLHAILRN
jgi:homocysteine S-methyltransferase